MDFIKIGIRIATVGGLIAAAAGVFAIFNMVQIPNGSFEGVVAAVGFGKALIHHWAPEFEWMIAAAIALFTVKWALFAAKWAVMGMKWILTMWK